MAAIAELGTLDPLVLTSISGVALSSGEFWLLQVGAECGCLVLVSSFFSSPSHPFHFRPPLVRV